MAFEHTTEGDAGSMVLEGVFIHPLADVEEGAQIGMGTKIWRFAHVRTGAVIGANSMVGNGCYIDSGVCIGDRVRIQNGVLVYNGVTIEDEVFLGPNMIFTNDLYPRADGRHWTIIPTLVRHGVSIGANSTIICGITIHQHAMVAAGSVVTRDVPPFVLVRGNPARQVGYVCYCGKKLGDMSLQTDVPLTCSACGHTVTLGQ